MDLIIVESPTKARTLGRFLGDKFVVDSTMGHVRDLPKSTLGVDVDHDFKPEYVDVAKKSDVVAKLREEADKADKIYLATDPDREGEAISYHVHELLQSNKAHKIPNENFKRIVFHEITENAVNQALSHPRTIDMQLVDAQQARRVLDRLVGYKLSPLLWKKVRKGLSAGRVQSVAVRLIVDREREIEAFRPEEYWDIGAELRTNDKEHTTKGQEFFAKLVKIGEDKAEVKNGEQAGKIVADLEKAAYKVASIERREVVKRSPAPFTTSTMTQAASRTHFWSAKKTMSVAQKLYEEGLITYHRTDSTNLAHEAVNNARAFIKNTYGEKFVPEKPRVFKTASKVAQEAHEAIRPTDVNLKFEILNLKLGREAALLYSLIWRRFVACQMSESVFDETTINVAAETYTLQAKGQIMKFEGWKKVYGRSSSAEATEDGVLLPKVEEGAPLQLIKVNSLQMFTQPPARYTEASLVKTLEKLGIGRPSTYAPTISTIEARQYVEKNEGKFSPTSVGIAVNDFLVTNFPHIVDYNFTAEMEGDLDEIANGKKEWVPVISAFWKPFSKKLEGVEETAKRVKIEVEKTGKKCPLCIAEGLPADKQGDEIIRIGRFGKFLSCSRFPDCKYTAPFVEIIDMKCPDCKTGNVIIKKTRRGKRFFGCSRYPECKWASWRKPGLAKNTENPENPALIANE